MAYEDIMKKIDEMENMSVESEEVLEDDSILITVICD